MPAQGTERPWGGPPLRLATHNVCGLDPPSRPAKLKLLVDGWVGLDLDVVLVQETGVSLFDASKTAERLRILPGQAPRGRGHSGFTVFWAHGGASDGSSSSSSRHFIGLADTF